MKKRLIAAVLLCCVLCAVTGCGGKSAPESTPEPDTGYEEYVTPALDVTLTDLVTEDQLAQIAGVPVTLQGVYDDGTNAVYLSGDGDVKITFSLQKMDRTVFDGLISGLEEVPEAAGEIGEAGWWVRGVELFAYQEGYALDVLMVVPGYRVPKEEMTAVAGLLFDALADRG